MSVVCHRYIVQRWSFSQYLASVNNEPICQRCQVMAYWQSSISGGYSDSESKLSCWTASPTRYNILQQIVSPTRVWVCVLHACLWSWECNTMLAVFLLCCSDGFRLEYILNEQQKRMQQWSCNVSQYIQQLWKDLVDGRYPSWCLHKPVGICNARCYTYMDSAIKLHVSNKNITQ